MCTESLFPTSCKIISLPIEIILSVEGEGAELDLLSVTARELDLCRVPSSGISFLCQIPDF